MQNRPKTACGWSLAAGLVLGFCAVAVAGSGRLAAEEQVRWVEIHLADGTNVTAPFVSSTRDSVTVYQDGANREIPMEQVKRVSYLDKAPAQAADTTPSTPVTPPATAPVVDPAATGVPTAPPPPPDADAPPTPGDNPAYQYVSLALPGVEAGKTEGVQLPLKWSQDGAAPWYETNRASSLHQMPDWKRASPAHEKEILEAIATLNDGDQSLPARRKLKGLETEAAPYLVIFLLDSDPRRAQVCAELLMERGTQDVAKYFIEALYAIAKEDGAALEPWLQPYARKLLEGCKKFTSTATATDPAKAGFTAAEFITTWKENMTEAGPQLGEPAFERDPVPPNAAVQKAAWIQFFRTLALKRVQFGEPKEEKVDLTRTYPHVKDAGVDRAILADLAKLATGKEADLQEAKDRLHSRPWPDIAPYLAQALVERKEIGLRLIILDMVGSQSDKGFTWHILSVLIEAWGVPTSVPGPNHAALIRVCDNLLRRLTGVTGQPAIQPTFVGGYKPIQGYIDFWNARYLEFPRQYGEPELDKTKAKYNEYLKELRLIKSGATNN